MDREPIGLERAAASCHIAMIGDSYMAALEVPIARIRTGQFTSDDGQIWKAEFPVAPWLVSE